MKHKTKILFDKWYHSGINRVSKCTEIHHLTTTQSEPLGRLWQIKRVNYSKLNLPNFWNGFKRNSQFWNKIWTKYVGASEPPPLPGSNVLGNFFLDFSVKGQTYRHKENWKKLSNKLVWETRKLCEFQLDRFSSLGDSWKKMFFWGSFVDKQIVKKK